MKQKILYKINLLIMLFVYCLLLSCTNDEENHSNNSPATISFYNESSFQVDIYKNLNPNHFDPTTLVCTVASGSTKVVTMYASTDQVLGDTFYPRYKVLLANILDTGTVNIYVDAQRTLSNMSFVVESGKTYTRTIPQPSSADLRFVNGYIVVQNMLPSQVQIIYADEVLRKLDDGGAYLNTGHNKGYYEIPLSSFTETLNITQLKASFSGSNIDFPNFVMERGKLYSFTITNSGITGPTITNLNPMAGK
jgi:hypothetical protein